MRNEELGAVLREIHHQRLHQIWQRVKESEPLDDPEEARIGRVMKDHPEYYRYWEKAAKYKGKLVTDKQGSNPFLHLSFEAVLESQLESEEIPEVKQALWFLVENGMDRHEARHTILNILVEEIWQVLKQKRNFDADAYKRKLRGLMKRQ